MDLKAFIPRFIPLSQGFHGAVQFLTHRAAFLGCSQAVCSCSGVTFPNHLQTCAPNPATPRLQNLPWFLCAAAVPGTLFMDGRSCFCPLGSLVLAAAPTGAGTPHPAPNYCSNELCSLHSLTHRGQTWALPFCAFHSSLSTFLATSQTLASILFFSTLAFHRFFATKVPTFHKTGISHSHSGNACAFLQYFLIPLRWETSEPAVVQDAPDPLGWKVVLRARPQEKGK